MSHDDCMMVRGELTNREQAMMTDWLVRTMRARPDDFIVEGGVVMDRESRLTFRLLLDDLVHVSDSVPHTGYLHAPYAEIVRNEAHRLRHRNGSPTFNALAAAMVAHPAGPLPALAIPKDEFMPELVQTSQHTYVYAGPTFIGLDPAREPDEARTEPEVTKLRRLVDNVMKNPVGAMAIAMAVAVVITGISQAFAG